jgi:TolB-like protein
MNYKLRALLYFFLISTFTFPSLSMTQNRDPEKIYKVAIIPFMIHSQENLDYLREGIHDMIASRIAIQEKVLVVEQSVVERALYAEKPMRLDEAAALKIGTRIGADYVILGSITKIRDNMSLDACLLSITEETNPVVLHFRPRSMDGMMVKIGEFAQEIGYRITGTQATAGQPEEPRRPLIKHAFTVEKIKYGDILKVYIEAEDPDSGMYRISTLVDQAGYGRYPLSWVYLKPTDRKYFKGYLQWNTFSPRASTITEGTPITLTVCVFGKAGKRSNTFTFPITFESGIKSKRGALYQSPPPFDQKNIRKLGTIDIELMDITKSRR